ncbi:MAG TPA: hypothetical protein PKC20_00965 [Burkholderiaceae bacterium]|nr:hypothetical protein [Burkholderiaceae bacterium]
MPKISYTYALRLTGTTKRSLPMNRCAEYIRKFADMLGGDARVHFAGIGEGSALLRALVEPEYRSAAHLRIIEARQLDGSEAYRAAQAINDALGADGYGAELQDSEGRVVFTFEPTAQPSDDDVLVYDSASIDGIVVGLNGADDTAHLRLRDVSGSEYRALVRDLDTARELAKRWRMNPVRVHLRGTWRRRAEDGVWVQATGQSLVVEGYEDLDSATVAEVFGELREIPGLEWSDMEAPLEAWRRLRG